MSFLAAAVVGSAAIGAGASYLSSQSSSKAIANSYKPVDINKVQSKALAADQAYWAASDADYAKNHPEALQAQGNFDNQILKEQSDLANYTDTYKDTFDYGNKGNSTLTPQLQSELMRAGLGSTLGSFGDTGANLASGSGAEASVARNLGLGIVNFQQQNLANYNTAFQQNEELKSDEQQKIANHQWDLTKADTDLSLQSQLEPHRTFGLSGEDVANVMTGNQAGQNAASLAAATNQANATNALISGLTSSIGNAAYLKAYMGSSAYTGTKAAGTP